jgi:hypothetical protein
MTGVDPLLLRHYELTAIVRRWYATGTAPQLVELKRTGAEIVELARAAGPRALGFLHAVDRSCVAARAVLAAEIVALVASTVGSEPLLAQRLVASALLTDHTLALATPDAPAAEQAGLAVAEWVRITGSLRANPDLAVRAWELAALERGLASGTDTDTGAGSALIFAVRTLLARSLDGTRPVDLRRTLESLRGELPEPLRLVLVSTFGALPCGTLIELDDAAWAVVVSDDGDDLVVREFVDRVGRVVLTEKHVEREQVVRTLASDEAELHVAAALFGA